VQGTAFVEMWSAFPGGGEYFSRTLADSGPMRKITGSSDWRDIVLPFYRKPGMLPNKLWVNVVLPGAGKVYLTPFELGTLDGTGDASDLWTEWQSGLIGGIGGSLVGLCGGLIGTLTNLARARRFTLAACWAIIIAGAISLATGVLALILGQPYHVWFPLLFGGVMSAVLAGQLPGIRRRYSDAEMRRIKAMDVP
jgi:hypothetical protein